jgi:PAS domain S-box-containing protein
LCHAFYCDTDGNTTMTVNAPGWNDDIAPGMAEMDSQQHPLMRRIHALRKLHVDGAPSAEILAALEQLCRYALTDSQAGPSTQPSCPTGETDHRIGNPKAELLAANPVPQAALRQSRLLEQQLAMANENLAARETLLQQILDTSSVAIFLVDQRGYITHANRCMAEMFGYPRNALVNKEYIALLHPAERESGRQKMLALLDSQFPAVDLERRYWRADHTEFQGHLTGKRFYDANGNESGLVGVIADITERKRAELALTKNEANFRRFFEENGSVMLLIDLTSGQIVLANQAASAYYGYALERLVGMSIDDINTLPASEVARQRQRVQQGEKNYFNFCHRLASGEVRDVEVYSAPTDVAGKPLIFSIIHDITERKQAEARLQLTASVFSHAREGIIITDADATIIEVNDTFSGITGYTREDVLGQNPRLLQSGQQPADYYCRMWQTLAEHGHWSGEICNKKKSGELYLEMLTISVVTDADGKAKNYVALFTDITPVKEYQQRLENMAHYDPLTGLPNRVLLAAHLQQAVAQSQQCEQAMAVFYLDLDGFKAINDQYGHHTGDALLLAVSKQMKLALREGDTPTMNRFWSACCKRLRSR